MPIRPTLLVLAVSLLAAPLGAQQSFARPALAAKADTNSWEAYFDLGAELLRRRPDLAEASFYWASRLDPARAEPLFGRWVAFHLLDQRRWIGYLDEQERVLRDPKVIAHDSLRLAAAARNPFVHRGLEIILYDEMPGDFDGSDLARGWIAYAAPDVPRALRLFGHELQRHPKRYPGLRWMRAEAFAATQQYDSAEAEMDSLRALLDARDAAKLVTAYESKEMLDYGVGFLRIARGQPDRARESMQAALVENAAFYPAHMRLGDVALDAGDPALAVREYEEALVTGDRDAVLHFHYGLALSRVGAGPEAAAALRRATTLEPWYAPPWLALGQVLAATGDAGGARDAFAAYLVRAPRTEVRGIALARAKLAADDR